jgi:hypothetical protein
MWMKLDPGWRRNIVVAPHFSVAICWGSRSPPIPAVDSLGSFPQGDVLGFALFVVSRDWSLAFWGLLKLVGIFPGGGHGFDPSRAAGRGIFWRKRDG